MRPKVYLTDREVELLIQDTGMSKLEVTGFISALNKYCWSDERISEWKHDEAMGRHIR